MISSDLFATWRELGPYCEIDAWAGGQAWRPLRELVDASSVLAERIEHARIFLASRSRVELHEIEERVAASTVFLGLAARFSSPVLGAAVVHHVVPRMSVDSLWWRCVDSGPLPIAWDREDVVVLDPENAGAQLAERLCEITDPLIEAFATRFKLSRQILRGNVASSLGGALNVLTAARPRLAGLAGSIVADALIQPPLAGAAELRRTSRDDTGLQLVRRSCCLFYRVPGGGTCGDCVLNARRRC